MNSISETGQQELQNSTDSENEKETYVHLLNQDSIDEIKSPDQIEPIETPNLASDEITGRYFSNEVQQLDKVQFTRYCSPCDLNFTDILVTIGNTY